MTALSFYIIPEDRPKWSAGMSRDYLVCISLNRHRGRRMFSAERGRIYSVCPRAKSIRRHKRERRIKKEDNNISRL